MDLFQSLFDPGLDDVVDRKYPLNFGHLPVDFYRAFNLTNGPGKVTVALGINYRFYIENCPWVTWRGRVSKAKILIFHKNSVITETFRTIMAGQFMILSVTSGPNPFKL